ncbi:MAG: SRPBCC family protein [Bacteroidia bacterium]
MNTPFTIERVYNAPADKVWRAISDNNEMQKWYFKLPEFKAEVGFEFQFDGGPPGETVYTHLCRVTEVVAGKKLSYTWQYKGYKGISKVTWEIFPEGNKTRLRLTHEGLESFAANSNPHFDPKNFEGGWTHIVGKSLLEFVEQ